jgi:hypothetical protein
LFEVFWRLQLLTDVQFTIQDYGLRHTGAPFKAHQHTLNEGTGLDDLGGVLQREAPK